SQRWAVMGLSLCLVCADGGFGQGSGPQAPAADRGSPAAATLRGPRVNKRVLLNGLPVFAIELPQAQTVAVHLQIKSGAAYDPLRKGGLADLTAEMLKAGTQLRTQAQIAKELEGLGLTLRTEVNWDATSLIGLGPANQAGRLIDLLADLALNPAFPE